MGSGAGIRVDPGRKIPRRGIRKRGAKRRAYGRRRAKEAGIRREREREDRIYRKGCGVNGGMGKEGSNRPTL